LKTVEVAAEYVAEQCVSLREELYNLLQNTLAKVSNPNPPALILTEEDLEAAICLTHISDYGTNDYSSLAAKSEYVPSYFPHLLALRFLQNKQEDIGVAVQHLAKGKKWDSKPPKSREEWINLGYTGQVPPCVSLLQRPSHYDLWVPGNENHGWAQKVMKSAKRIANRRQPLRKSRRSQRM
jgi:hypothetical protein